MSSLRTLACLLLGALVLPWPPVAAQASDGGDSATLPPRPLDAYDAIVRILEQHAAREMARGNSTGAHDLVARAQRAFDATLAPLLSASPRAVEAARAGFEQAHEGITTNDTITLGVGGARVLGAIGGGAHARFAQAVAARDSAAAEEAFALFALSLPPAQASRVQPLLRAWLDAPDNMGAAVALAGDGNVTGARGALVRTIMTKAAQASVTASPVHAARAAGMAVALGPSPAMAAEAFEVRIRETPASDARAALRAFVFALRPDASNLVAAAYEAADAIKRSAGAEAVAAELTFEVARAEGARVRAPLGGRDGRMAHIESLEARLAPAFARDNISAPPAEDVAALAAAYRALSLRPAPSGEAPAFDLTVGPLTVERGAWTRLRVNLSGVPAGFGLKLSVEVRPNVSFPIEAGGAVAVSEAGKFKAAVGHDPINGTVTFDYFKAIGETLVAFEADVRFPRGGSVWLAPRLVTAVDPEAESWKPRQDLAVRGLARVTVNGVVPGPSGDVAQNGDGFLGMPSPGVAWALGALLIAAWAALPPRARRS